MCIRDRDPTIPIGLMATLDYGWFILLTLAPWLLPDSPPIVYTEITTSDSESESKVHPQSPDERPDDEKDNGSTGGPGCVVYPAFWVILNSNRDCAKNGSDKIHPVMYLQASFEAFLFMLGLCWILTWTANPDIIDSNRIKDVFGYNNVCVGFDTTPARYFAQPLMALQGFYGIRYVTLDNLRADLGRVQAGTEHDPAGLSYWFTYITNSLFACTMLLWGMLLIALPEGRAFTYHFYIYAVFVVIMYLTIFANFLEAYIYKEPISRLGAVWCVVFGAVSYTHLTLPTKRIV
eukprot:TRINITY_DN1851_c0_g1_i1.p1 TRINITY_DN1851_c0_g1~~TRINITY_DN1851_c0_g1_i1.p1  ORF type:complete len:291 (-),score=64.35 TRINITY_DN1851_c0_g1_i1:114-986(-)